MTRKPQPIRIDVHGIEFHRNGISGASFYLINFYAYLPDSEHPPGQRLVGVVFDQPGHVAVIDVDPTHGCPHAHARLKSKWRGDQFEDALRGAITLHEQETDPNRGRLDYDAARFIAWDMNEAYDAGKNRGQSDILARLGDRTAAEIIAELDGDNEDDDPTHGEHAWESDDEEDDPGGHMLLTDVFDRYWAVLSNEQQSLIRMDIDDIVAEESGELTRAQGARLLRERIGGPANLGSYVKSLEAGARRRKQ